MKPTWNELTAQVNKLSRMESAGVRIRNYDALAHHQRQDNKSTWNAMSEAERDILYRQILANAIAAELRGDKLP